MATANPSCILQAQKNTQLDLFISDVNKKHKKHITDYEQLYSYSISDFQFWVDVMDFCKIKYHGAISHIVDDIPMDQIPKWFNSIKINYCENIFSNCDFSKTAVIWLKEDFVINELTYKQLYDQVSVCQQALVRFGIQKGDVVASYCPNSANTLIWFLACNAIGAIWSSTSCDFGVTAVFERFNQINPKLIFSVNAVLYNKKVYSQLDKLTELRSKFSCPIIVDSFISTHSTGDFQTYSLFTSNLVPCAISYTLVDFHSPIYILFSSGTTGQPKCIVHGNGALIQHLKEHVIQGSITAEDKVFQYTTTGWMMWNWLISALKVTTIVLFDGSPFQPSPQHLWQLVQDLQITVFGTSAKYLQSLQQFKIYPKDFVDLKYLRTITSTGSPLKPESYSFVFSKIKPLLLGSITGGTDIVSCFCGYTTNLPLYPGEIQCCNLGMEVYSYKDGKAVYDEAGDLVCTRAFPSMPLYFLNGQEAYKKAYFNVYPQIWHHGDYCLINSKTGGILMLGRSDGTLKPGGVRFGSAELYKVIDQIDWVIDSLAIGQAIEDDERVVLFVKLQGALEEEQIKEIKTKIRVQLSPRHVPAIIMKCPDIPVSSS
eukprot:NODE_324_length_10963_cov_0.175350.p1 type:complete len:598 gc:universal NODE_324_length_10963_cov_0.175350:2340-4133(+)